METIKKYTDTEILNINPLSLALVGDAVFSLYVRDYLLSNHKCSVNTLSVMASKIVNAGNQYNIYREIENLLTPYEIELCHRARNSNIHSKAKNYSVTEYIYATAFEALLGYLYLTDNKARLNLILEKSMEIK